MLESAHKNTGFLNYIFESTAQIASHLMAYFKLVISARGHRVAMFESVYKNKCWVNTSNDISILFVFLELNRRVLLSLGLVLLQCTQYYHIMRKAC